LKLTHSRPYILGQILDEIGKGQGSFQDAINKLAMAMAIIGAFDKELDFR